MLVLPFDRSFVFFFFLWGGGRGRQVKEQKEEAERFQRKLKEMEDVQIETFLVQLFHINKARQ